jgi:hypothetical protein
VHPQRRQVDRGEQFVEAAAAVAAEGRTSAWHRQQSALYRDQSARAAWLHDHTATWRTLALALWAGQRRPGCSRSVRMAVARRDGPARLPDPVSLTVVNPPGDLNHQP